MTTALTVQRDHLRPHRRLLIGRSLAAAMAGAIPVPLLDERLVYLVLRGTYRRLARDYQVDIDARAVQSLVYGRVEPPSLTSMAGTALALRMPWRIGRKLVAAYLTSQRAQVAGHYFLRATLFDHYCAKLHVGLGLDGATALALREVMDQAVAETSGGLGWRVFRRGVVAAARATARAPMELVHIASGGLLRKLLSSTQAEEAEAVDELDMTLERHMDAQQSFLARAVTAVELQLSAEANPYLERLVSTFERLWRERRELESTVRQS